MKNMIWLLTIVFLIGLPSVRATNDTEVPYIFFYSHVLNGIVIERADGTDSRIIGQGLADRAFSMVEGAGWSPDGQWFVWQMSGYFGTAPYPITSPPYAISVDGQKTVAFLEDFDCPDSMYWSPDGRYLLIRGMLLVNRETGCPPYYSGPLATYWLIDMQSQSLINSLSIDSSLDAATLLWELDEQQIRFAELKHFSPGSQHVVVTMHFHGAVEIEPISEQEWEQLYDIARTSGSNASDHDNNFKRLPDSNNMPSPDGRYVPDDQSWGSWIDTQTGQRIRFPGNSSAAVPGSVGSYWHPDSEWVFLGYEWCFAGCGLVVGRVNIFNPASGHVREIADCHSHPTCVNWLPEQVNIEELPPGRSTSLLPEPESIDYRTGFAAENDGLTFILEDVATHVLMCNLESQPRSMTLVQNETTGEIDFILPSGEACNFIQEGEAYVPEMRAIFFALSPDNRYYAITNQIGNTEYTSLFDAQTGELIATLNIYGIRLEFSDDSVTLITWGRYAIATWDILDMERGLVWE